MAVVEAAVTRLLREGTRLPHTKPAGWCNDLLWRGPALWTFVREEGVEPTNNAAERALRPAVLWRKRCFGTQSSAGSCFVERMLTVIATCRQQQRHLNCPQDDRQAPPPVVLHRHFSAARSFRWSSIFRCGTPVVHHAGAGSPLRWWSKNSRIRWA